MDQFCHIFNKHAFGRRLIVTVIVDVTVLVSSVLLKTFTVPLMNILPECWLATAGIPCGSCGGTRCVYQLVSGNFISAFNYNQFFFIVFIYLILTLISLNIDCIFKNRITRKIFNALWTYKAVIVFSVGYAVFTLIRFIDRI